MKKTHRKTIQLLHPYYPIGWGTGLNEKQWREFAENYVPFNER